MKMIRGLGSEDKLRDMGFFILEKKRLLRDLAATFQHLKGA